MRDRRKDKQRVPGSLRAMGKVAMAVDQPTKKAAQEQAKRQGLTLCAFLRMLIEDYKEATGQGGLKTRPNK